LQEFAGDLDDYQQWLRSRGKAQPTAPAGRAAAVAGAGKAGGKSAAAGKPAAPAVPAAKQAPRRDPLIKLRRQLEQVEARIAAVAAERALLETELAENPLENNLALRRANLERDAAFLETQWMEIGIAIEAAEAKGGTPLVR
jgi:ATP-binding cassette subfamily F protein 3